MPGVIREARRAWADMPPVIRFLRLPESDPAVPLPSYETEGAAGADIRANLSPSDRGGISLVPGERRLVPTGFACEIPEGFEVQVRPRSGLALRHGIGLVNAPGTIDSDYRGAVGVILINHGQEPVTVAHGDRIAQLVVAPVVRARFEEAVSLSDTPRSTGGFGSTGRG